MASRTYEMAFSLAGKLDSTFKNMTSSASERLQNVQSRIRELGQGQQRIEKFKNLKRQLAETRKEYEQAQDEVRRLAQEIEASERPTREQQRAFEQAKKKSQQLKRSLDSQQGQLQELRTEMREAGQSTRNLAEQQQNLARQTRLAQRRAEGWSRVANSNVSGAARDTASHMGTLAMRTSIAGGALSATAGYLVHDYARAATETQRFADRLGMATEKLSGLQFAGRQFGVQQESLVDGLKEMSMRADEFAKTGSGPAAEAFKRLGFSKSEIDRVKGDTQALFELISQKMSGVQDVAARQRIADELMGGQAGEKMVEMLSAGRGELEKMQQQGRRVGATVSGAEGRQAETFMQALRKVQGALQGIQKTVISEILPQLTKGLNNLTSWVEKNQQRIQTFAENLREKLKSALPSILGMTRGIASMAGVIASLIGKVAGLVGGFRNLGIVVAAAFSAKVIASAGSLAMQLWSMGRGLVQVLASMNLVSGATKAWTAAQWALNVAMNANPIGLIVAGAAALGGIAYYVITRWEKVKSWFTGLWDWISNLSLFKAGKHLISTLVSGITSVAGQVYKSVKDALGWVGKLLPGSDAKEGPLSQLTKAGRAIPQTMAKGVKQSAPQLKDAASRAMAGPGRPAGTQAAPAQAGGQAVGSVQPAQSGPAGGQVTVYQTFQIDGQAQEPETEIRRAGQEAARETERAVESYFQRSVRLGYA